MNKINIKLDVLKKIIARLIKAAPAKKSEPMDPLVRLVRAFLEYDCDDARAELAEKKLQSAMVDMNELRVTPAIELATLVGVRYPFAESRCSGLHRTLQSIFDREHQMKLDRMKEMKKAEIRPYLQSLGGITPYVEAVVCLECFDVQAVPVDTKLLLWLVSKDALPEGIDIRTAQQILEKHVKPSDMGAMQLGARRELEDWTPKSWPVVAKAYSPMLAPPPLNAQGEEIRLPQDPVPTSSGKSAETKKDSSSAEAKKAAAAAAKIREEPRKGSVTSAKRK